MRRIFFIPGLGADKRIYRHIKAGTDADELVYIDWIEPERIDTLTSYAQKLIQQYNITQNSIVIGNSLGGMLAVEIANQIRLDKVILLSSIKTIDEAPFYFKLFRTLPVHKLIPGKLFSKMGALISPIFGKMYSVDAFLFNSMLQNTSPVFLKWAMGAALHWQNKTIPANLYHITGDKDHVFNYRKIKSPTVIPGGTHIMIFDRAEEINVILADILKD
ncbi:alpha/beta hydrolase [Mucilaginibacter myungsuensis]|uniref:Alpha/beta hydrolase n=1 Tax=Mucilaginibacter myungsuensis TaxID=649104 RepID=A0A929L074_9SPHI|nr:alpha/beta hydrolase [Mucilaginibacter myungsuensis]MBE9664422.1 alpha/beta hydrolase [Mucilaginibacter myungsuensis]MDN3597133.1 alpha/beta hydrolase [Mucilaginibacter myungsuensis]